MRFVYLYNLKVDNRHIFSDIKSWFERTTQLRLDDRASSVDFQRSEKTLDKAIPHELKTILSETNGGIWIMEKPLLSLERICDLTANFESSRLWKESYLPFAGDESSVLLIDTSKGASVFEWDSDDGIGDAVSPSLSNFFENYRNSLLEGHCEFLMDVGVIEKVAKSKK